MNGTSLRQRMSRIFHAVDRLTSRVGTVTALALVLITYLVTLASFGFPVGWQVGFSTVANAIVLVMLFVLKHTQSRQETALQLKLDELIRSIPDADDHLVQIERAEEHELEEREQEKIAVHEDLRRPGRR